MRTHHTPPSVRQARLQNPHNHSSTRVRIFAPRIPRERVDRSRRAYLGRARLLDARTGGVGGLGGNHGVGLGNHRRRVTARRGVRVCRGRPMARRGGRWEREVDR